MFNISAEWKTMQKVLDSAKFVTIQANEMFGVSCQSQMSILLHCCLNNSVQEWLIGFFDVSKYKTAPDSVIVILNLSNDRNMDKKLFYKTCIGGSTMAGSHSDAQEIIKQNALTVCSFTVVLTVSELYFVSIKARKKVCYFFYDLTIFQALSEIFWKVLAFKKSRFQTRSSKQHMLELSF